MHRFHDASWAGGSMPTIAPWWYRPVTFLSFLLLIPILTFPAGADQAIYAVGGRMLLDGMTYYRDIVDLKPPFIHLIYGIGNGIFGDGMFAVRIVELFAQWVTLLLLMRLVNRHVEDRGITAIAALLYSMMYVSLGPDATGQPESYVGLFLFPACGMLLERRTNLHLIGAGVLASMLVLVKYSMILLPALFVLAPFLLRIGDRGSRRRETLLIAWGCLIPGLLYLFWLSTTGALPGFWLVNDFLSSRMRATLANDGFLGRFQAFGLWIGFGFGAATSFLLAFALWRTASPGATGAPEGRENRLMRLLGLAVLTLFASAVMELMLLPYQFSRIYGPAAVLLAWILRDAWHAGLARRYRATAGAYAVLTSTALTLLALTLSPVPRYALESMRGAAWRFSPEAEGNPWFTADLPVLADLRSIGDTIRASASEDDRLVVVSGYSGHLYCYTGIVPIFSSLHGHQVIAGFAPEPWKVELRQVLDRQRPEFVAVERNDQGAARLVNAKSTDEAVAGIPGVGELLRQKYDTLATAGAFVLYRARE